MKVKKRIFCQIFYESPSDEAIQKCLDYSKSLPSVVLSEKDEEVLEMKLKNLMKKYNSWMKSCCRKWDYFQSKHHDYLEEDLKFDFRILKKPTQTVGSAGMKRGRPVIPYEDKSDNSKRVAVSRLSDQLNNNSELVLKTAALSALRNGNKELQATIKYVAKDPETAAKKIFKDSFQKFTNEEALAFFINLKLSKSQYLSIRSEIKKRGADLLPSYQNIRQSKVAATPENIHVTTADASVPLQSLLNHTATRIVKFHEQEILSKIGDDKVTCVNLITNWGCDGSSNQQIYNYSPTSSTSELNSSSLFASTIVPLQVQLQKEPNTILWQNPTPHSVRFCRPIKITYEKETKELILKTKHDMDQQITELRPLPIQLSNSNTLLVQYSVFCKACDGKVVSYLTESSSFQVCSFCHAKPSELNNLENIENGKFNVKNEDFLDYGLSPLHCWIRIFECCLHISYKIEIKKTHPRKV